MKKDFKILYIGDSHSVMTMGQVLSEKLKNVKADLFFFAVTGSTFEDWMENKIASHRVRNVKELPGSAAEFTNEALVFDFFEEFRSINPDFLIIALGTNDMRKYKDHFPTYLNKLKIHLQKLMSTSSQTKWVWIMPPEFPEGMGLGQNRADLAQSLSKEKKIHVIDILGFFPDQEDKIHFNKERAQHFAEKIFMELRKILKSTLQN